MNSLSRLAIGAVLVLAALPSAARAQVADKVMGELAATHSGNVFDFTHYAMVMWATAAAFPGLQLTDVFTDEGAGVIDTVFDQMCKLGGNVARVQLAGEQDHYETPGKAQPLYVPWVRDRFEGKPLADGCAEGTPAGR